MLRGTSSPFRKPDDDLGAYPRLFPVDPQEGSPYFPRTFAARDAHRERVAQPVEQLTFNQ